MRWFKLVARWGRTCATTPLLLAVLIGLPSVSSGEDHAGPGAPVAPHGEAEASVAPRAEDGTPVSEIPEEERYKTPEDQFWRGFNYLYGRGVEIDPVESVVWFRRGAEQGHARAQVHMGMAYLKGRGVERDPKEAAEWFMLAAEQNHPKAQMELGVAYIRGKGVRRNRVEGLKWLILAYQSGGLIPRYTVPRYTEQATPEQLAEAATLVREWRRDSGFSLTDLPETGEAGDGS